jgi:hypothetical protein
MNHYFGVTSGLIGENTVPLLHDLGVGWVRSPINRGQCEKRRRWSRRPRYEWKALRFLQSLKASVPGLKVLLTVRNHPHDPGDLPGYERFMIELVLRGAPWADGIQCENEANSPAWWPGTPGQYMSLLRVGSTVVKEWAPQITTLVAGPTSQAMRAIVRGDASGDQLGYAVRLVDAMPYVDAFDLHCYHEPDNITAYVEWLREHTNKPVWITEAGGPDSRVAEYSEQAQAADVRHRVAVARAAGVDKFFMLHLHPAKAPPPWDVMALCGPGGEPKPVFHAYKELIAEHG